MWGVIVCGSVQAKLIAVGRGERGHPAATVWILIQIKQDSLPEILFISYNSSIASVNRNLTTSRLASRQGYPSTAK